MRECVFTYSYTVFLPGTIISVHYILYAVCCMLCTVCCVLYAVCCMLCTVCYVLYAVYCILSPTSAILSTMPLRLVTQEGRYCCVTAGSALCIIASEASKAFSSRGVLRGV
jgi:hypothetical protein